MTSIAACLTTVILLGTGMPRPNPRLPMTFSPAFVAADTPEKWSLEKI